MKPRRTVAATELRVHLGEALRALEDEDLVVEKGGVPVALLTKYRPAAEDGDETMSEYEKALGYKGNPAAWPRALAAMERGWAGINAEELVENIYRWREEGVKGTYYSFDEAEEDAEDGEVPDRQRRLHPRRQTAKRVAEEPSEPYQA